MGAVEETADGSAETTVMPTTSARVRLSLTKSLATGRFTPFPEERATATQKVAV